MDEPKKPVKPVKLVDPYVKVRKKYPRRKHGRPTAHDDATVGAIILSNPSVTPGAIARILNRRKNGVIAAITQARQTLANALPLAAEHLVQASAVAASQGDGRPAMWLLDRVGHIDDVGVEHRAVAREKQQVQSSQGVTVNIGFAVGNLPQSAQLPILVGEGTPIAVSARRIGS